MEDQNQNTGIPRSESQATPKLRAARPSTKFYLGDGVYICCDGYGIILTTENGISTTNTIYLEPPVFNALLDYAKVKRQ
jgi:hypothetical protein